MAMAPAAAPPSLVQGPVRSPIPYGLFSHLVVRPPDADRWGTGVVWESLTCSAAGLIGAWNPDGPTTGLPKNLAGDSSGGEASVFTVYGHFSCSPVGWTASAAQSRAEQHLLIREEQAVEAALWSGAPGQTPTFPGTASVVLPAKAAPLKALAALEEALASSYGSLGIIHLTRGAALRLLADSALEHRSGKLFTALGTPVVAGSGYSPVAAGPGSALPEVGAVWAYATPALLGYRSDVFTSTATPGDLLDRAQNTLYAVAERSYLVGYDECGASAVQIDLG